MKDRNHRPKDWYNKIKLGEIKLPLFQRFEAWVRQRICSLIETVIHNLTLGTEQWYWKLESKKSSSLAPISHKFYHGYLNT